MIDSDHITPPVETLPEERRLLREVKSGNADAFVQLYDAYVERVYRYVYFRVSDDMAAESITSRVFIKAWEQLGHYPIIASSFFSWLCKIARKQVTEYYRIHPRVPGLDDGIALIAAESGGLDERVQDIFDLQAMRDALQFLTEEQRQVLILKFIAGLPTEAIARMMGRREETIRSLQIGALQILARIEARKDTGHKEFQRALETCLATLIDGGATVDECLARYPEYAVQLRPLVRTVLFLDLARAVQPSPAFSAHTRANLIEYLRFHARQPQPAPTLRRLALSTAIIVIALLVTGTVHAQRALPGDTFYGWKRTSEEVWRAASLDPVTTDIMIAHRRVGEWLATANDPERSASALEGYSEVISRLESSQDVETLARVVPVIETHQQVLENAGLSNSNLGHYVAAELNSLPDTVVLQTSPTQVPALQPTPVPVQPTAAAIEPAPTDAPPTSIPDILPTPLPPPTATPRPMPTAIPTEIPPTPQPAATSDTLPEPLPTLPIEPSPIIPVDETETPMPAE